MNPYPSYKESGVEWIGEIPDEWTTNKIKYLTDGKKDSFIDGDWIESTNISDSGIRYITTGNIGEGVYKEQGKGYISEETFEKLDCTEVFSGDLVISRLSPPVGRSCIIPNLQTRIVTSVDNVILRPKKDIDKNFLNFIFNSQGYYSHTDLISRGTTLTRISRTMLGNNKIVLPPIQEQQQISNYLEHKTQQIDSLTEKTQQKIELLKEQRTSLINQVVTKGLNPDVEMKDSGVEWIGEIPSGWNLKRIKYLLKDYDGIKIGPFGSSLKLDTLSDSGIKIYGQGNVIKDDFNLGIRYLPLDRFEEEFTQYEILEGDVLVTMMGTTGKSKVFSKNFDRGILDSHLLRLRFNKSKFSSNLFVVILQESHYISHQIRLSSKGSIMEGLNSSIIKELRVVTPPLKEQQQIVDYLDKETTKIDSTIEKENQRIDLLKKYRQSLISEVVTGKVDIRDEVVV